MSWSLVKVYRAFGPHLRPYAKWFAFAYAGLAATVLIKLVQPWPLKLILDYILLNKPMPEWLATVSNALGERIYLVTVTVPRPCIDRRAGCHCVVRQQVLHVGDRP